MGILKNKEIFFTDASLFFKNSCFNTEEEMRFVAEIRKNRLNDINYKITNEGKKKMYDFRISNGVFIPFIRMPLFGWSVEESWISTEIRVGPCLNFNSKKRGVLQFIESLDYTFNKIEIFCSAIPLG